MKTALKRLARAWECINVTEYMDKAQKSSIDNGEGMNVFRFLSPSTSAEKGGNCEYYYADKECTLWSVITDKMPNRLQFEKVYESTKAYVVCVCVPVDEHGDDTVQTVKIFNRDTNQEIIF